MQLARAHLPDELSFKASNRATGVKESQKVSGKIQEGVDPSTVS